MAEGSIEAETHAYPHSRRRESEGRSCASATSSIKPTIFSQYTSSSNSIRLITVPSIRIHTRIRF